MSKAASRVCACGCRRSVKLAPTGRPRRYYEDACRVAAWRKRQRRSVHFSSKTVEWPTPQHFYDDLDAEFGPFDLDPCATPENAKCGRTAEQDGLAQEWTGRVFVNPPYGRAVGKWMEKAWRSANTTAALVVCLVPARTDTRWWHEWAVRGQVRFVRGRLRFGDAGSGAPFPSAVVVFRNAEAASSRNETYLREAA